MKTDHGMFHKFIAEIQEKKKNQIIS